ncbi:MAG TPA: S4 domain-containing protein [Steroidobacteraceae bacterium]
MSAAAAPARLQKVLAELGLASRREAEQWIRAGRVSVNGQPAVLGQRVGAGDQLSLDGRSIRQRAMSRHAPVLLCHRSPGIPLLPKIDRGTALAEQLPRRAGRRFISVSPMPLVDGGLEVLTADGGMAARLQRAVHDLASEFSVRVRGELSEAQRAGALQGLLDRGTPLRVRHIDSAGGEGMNRWYQLEAVGASGNHVRQLLERLGITVSRVLRTRLGPLALERTLPRGRWRELSEAELQGLLSPPVPDNPDSDPSRRGRPARAATDKD